MGDKTRISYIDATFNPWRGCMKVSPGCEHCFAEAETKRWGKDLWGPRKPRLVTSKAYWRGPLAWDRAAAVAGRPALVLCGSLCDVLEDRRDLAEPRARLWGLIERTPNLIWLLLTKRIENAALMWPAEWAAVRTPANVWLGVTAEDQAMADLRIPYLLGRTVAVRFVSCEPLLGPVDLRAWLGEGPLTAGGIGWVIVGGESGPERREMDVAWIEDIVAQCHVKGVRCFIKQDAGLHPGAQGRIPDELWRIKEFPDALQRS